jgi:hypothetical protein
VIDRADFNEANIDRLLHKWQKSLRLLDWDIKYYLVEKEWRKTGDIKIDLHDRTAILLINVFNPKQTNIEELIIHELLHLKLYEMDQMIEELIACVYKDGDAPGRELVWSRFMNTLEPTVNDLAKSFLAIGGTDKDISFGRLDEEVREELA